MIEMHHERATSWKGVNSKNEQVMLCWSWRIGMALKDRGAQ